jgi:SAM-dependent methyltransferase
MKNRQPAAAQDVEHMAVLQQDRTALPLEFDPDFYRTLYPELIDRSDAALRNHFESIGRREGRQGSAASLRAGLVGLISKGESVLEIGPFCGPNLVGSNVFYFDIMDREGLVARAESLGLYSGNAKAIHYVHAEGDLSSISDRFDAAFSSHCIEHTPDLIDHLQKVAELLPVGGRYYLIIPDKRFCFDHFLPASTIEEVLASHAERRRFHRLVSIIDHSSLATHNDSARHWAGDHAEPGFWSTISDRVLETIKNFRSTPPGYIDAHAWQFTPASFRAILGELANQSLCPLYPERVYDTPYGAIEFCAVLVKQ